MNLKTILLLAIITSIIACGGKNNGKTEQQETTPVVFTPLNEPSAIMTSMRMQKWEVTDMIYDNDGIGIALEKKPYLIFRDGRASGFAGCNSFVGQYEEGENSGLKITNIGATKKMCQEGNLEESRLLELLSDATSYALNSDHTRLKILSPKGEIHFILK